MITRFPTTYHLRTLYNEDISDERKVTYFSDIMSTDSSEDELLSSPTSYLNDENNNLKVLKLSYSLGVESVIEGNIGDSDMEHNSSKPLSKNKHKDKKTKK